LHDPSILPSDHLNVTVLIQDKDKERQSSVRRVVGKAVLDTAVAPSGTATPFSRLDAVSTLVPSCSQPRLSVTS
jgi:hypothetical protein